MTTALSPKMNEEWDELSPLSDSKRGGGGNLLLQKTSSRDDPPPINTRRGSLTTIAKNNSLSQTLRRHSTNSSSRNHLSPINHIPRNDSSLSALSSSSGIVSSSQSKRTKPTNKLRHSMESSPAKLSCQSSNQRCSDSYRMFQRCSSGSSDLSTISCGAAVASYMKCAFDQC